MAIYKTRHFLQITTEFFSTRHLFTVGCSSLVDQVHTLTKCCDFGLKPFYSLSTGLFRWKQKSTKKEKKIVMRNKTKFGIRTKPLIKEAFI